MSQYPVPDVITSQSVSNYALTLLDDTSASEARLTLGMGEQVHVSDPAGGIVVDIQARLAVDSILDILEAVGLMATS